MTTHDARSTVEIPGFGADGVLLAEQIAGQIERRACGRIRDLAVTCSEDRVILSGRSRTYHAKQMAQEAALDFALDGTALLNRIIVA